MFNFAFDSFDSFIFMDGHGIYVWSVFCIVIISLISMFMFYKNQLKKLKKKHINE
tara:strand:+ start:3732 stop:3896 length:165 start_codon:yes stop_codon:yes gene_type:complete